MAPTTPLFVHRGETICSCACRSTQEHTQSPFSDSSLLVWHHLHPLDRKFQNWLGSPQHHRSVCKGSWGDDDSNNCLVFYGMYGKVGKSHTVKYEQPLCFMVTLLLFVTLGSVDKKTLAITNRHLLFTLIIVSVKYFTDYLE